MKAIFLTGQSNRDSCSLSPIQKKVADLLHEEGIAVAPLNFPYDKQMVAYREINLLSASVSNGLQWLFSRTPAFVKRYREHVIEQFEEENRYVVLAGSCGLELLNNLQLPDEVLKKLHVIAYGPVARALPKSQVTTIQGRGDRLSKWFFEEVDHRVSCGHMDYLECDEVITLVLETAGSIKNSSSHEKKAH